jgi:hydrogenase maturation protein HypF
MDKQTVHIHINGIVQGVGFRPFVYNLALENNLFGWVRNSASGVDIELTGPKDTIKAFIAQIESAPPPLAQIDSVHMEEIPFQDFTGFEIIHSADKAGDFIPISPDVAICDDCQAEMFDPHDRRYRYPFINCTNCGPRFTIIREIPYDRPKTTMKSFAMCPDCLEEYENPRDRRFHAQPVACSICGPQVWLENPSGEKIDQGETAIQTARAALKAGKILAIKGLGGFHLACDATLPEAVIKLRQRKHRPAKPFALMAFDLETIQKYVNITPAGEALLDSPQAPIVLLPRKKGQKLAPGVAPGQSRLGFMLPYTPLHQLLLEPAPGFPEVLVMTSGNISEAPVIRDNQEAREKLSEIADVFLMHDRPIHMRMDDSVMAVVSGVPYPIRRARGYAPNPIRVTDRLPEVLAVGPQMKNTFCLTRENYAFLSHHIGEMDNWETVQDYHRAVTHYEDLFRIRPSMIACDLHPDYQTTHYAHERAAREGLPLIAVQHHHAHLAAGMIENKIHPDQPVGGLIFDGTGFGTDGTIWGGEIMIGNCRSFDRCFSLHPAPLPGGELAIQKPGRMALSLLWANDMPWEEDLAPVKSLSGLEKQTLRRQLENQINAPLTSSMGRLFDGIASLIGLRHMVSYEAQAAIELETLASQTLADEPEMGYYPWEMGAKHIIIKPVLEAVIKDLRNNVPNSIIAARFHNTIAHLSLSLCEILKEKEGIIKFVLSGGVWQNQYLLEKTICLLEQKEFIPLIHRQTPPNDGCVAFGQAMVAAYRYQQQ